jgi:hypothetical protein
MPVAAGPPSPIPSRLEQLSPARHCEYAGFLILTRDVVDTAIAGVTPLRLLSHDALGVSLTGDAGQIPATMVSVVS